MSKEQIIHLLFEQIFAIIATVIDLGILWFVLWVGHVELSLWSAVAFCCIKTNSMRRSWNG